MNKCRQNEKVLRLEAFSPEHFKLMQHRAETEADLAGLKPETLFDSWMGGRTLFCGDEVVAIYGSQRFGGTANLWALTSPLASRYPVGVTRIALTCIDELFAAGALRVEALCHAGNARSYKWLTRLLGFRHEGTLRRCGPNRQDRHILSIIIEDRMEKK